jgi:hypothetical protein
MAFTIPENLHPELMPLAWLVGTWRGKGRGEYPTIALFNLHRRFLLIMMVETF